ncbi:MAG: nascent polypeptide-associated complex protein [Candidatus Aenigmatarchaeota archaeon]
MKINPKQMERMAKQLGMKTEEIDAEQVIIKLHDGEIIINNPQVYKINIMGQNTFQITGDVIEKSAEEFSEDDIDMVAEQAGVSHDEARRVLDETRDIAEAILRLKEDHKR